MKKALTCSWEFPQIPVKAFFFKTAEGLQWSMFKGKQFAIKRFRAGARIGDGLASSRLPANRGLIG
jgi:hypothetical protein